MLKRDVHQELTAKIIAQIEAGAGDFQMPWHQSSTGSLALPKNIDTGKHYRGINILSLWGASQACGYSSNMWGTYKQWQAAGCQVRKGERASLVVIYKEFFVDPAEGDAKDDGKRMFAKASSAFNAEQVDGYQAPDLPGENNNGPIARLAACDTFARNTGAIIRNGGNRAFYSPSTDHVQMPDETRFFGDDGTRTANYYSVLLHELTHWSGHKNRCDRQFGKRFGDAASAFEELVAELGAAFLCAGLGIANEPRKDHAQYIATWLRVLKNDTKAISHAAAKASAAVDYLSAPRQAASLAA